MSQKNGKRFKRRHLFQLLTAGGIAGAAAVTGEQASAQAAEKKSKMPLKPAQPLNWWQDNWRWCNKCQGLFFAGSGTAGWCPAGGGHNWAGSGNFSLLENN